MKSRRIVSLIVAAILLVTSLTVIGLLQATAAEVEISDAAGLQAITGNGTYKLTANIDLADANFTTIASFAGTLDGNGKRITGISTPLFDSLAGEVKNLTLEGEINDTTSTTAIGALANQAGSALTVTSVTNKVNVTTTAATATGGFIGEVNGTNAVTFVGCINDGAIDGSGSTTGVGGFVGTMTGSGKSAHAVVKAEYSVNNGEITNTSGDGTFGAAGFVGSGARYTVEITYSVNNASVTSQGLGLGGFFGVSRSTWKNGDDTSRDIFTARYCANYGDITATSTGAEGVGGIAGRLARANNMKYTIEYCYNTGAITGGKTASGILGYTNNGSGISISVGGCYNIGVMSESTYRHEIGMTGSKNPSEPYPNYFMALEGSVISRKSNENYVAQTTLTSKEALNEALVALGEYVVVPDVNDGYAILRWQCPHGETTEGCTGTFCDLCGAKTAEGSGTHSWSAWSETKPATELEDGERTRSCSACHEVETEIVPATRVVNPIDGVYYVAGEAQYAWLIQNLNSGNVPANAEIVLQSDITDGTDTVTVTFSGSFDGGNHTISGMTKTMFNAMSGATVKNLTLEGTITAPSGDKRIGTLVKKAENDCVIDNVHSSAILSVKNGDLNAGGLVGLMREGGTVKNSSFSGTLTAEWNGTNAGVGGIIGYGNKNITINNCVFSGSITVKPTDGVLGKSLWCGGIIGYLGSNATFKVNDCSSRGTIEVTKLGGDYAIGGLLGSTIVTTRSTNLFFEGTIVTPDNTSVGAEIGAIVGNLNSGTATLDTCISFVAGLPAFGGGSVLSATNCFTAEEIRILGEPFTLKGKTYQRYNFGYYDITDPANPEFETGGLNTANEFNAYLSLKDNGTTHDVRVVLLANFQKLVGIAEVDVTVTFMKNNQTVKETVLTLGADSEDFALCRSIVAADNVYFAADAHALFGVVVKDIPDGAWDAVCVQIDDSASGETYYAGELTYS